MTKESPYPLLCLLFSALVAVISVTGAKDREMAVAGLGFAGSILASGGTAFHQSKPKEDRE